MNFKINESIIEVLKTFNKEDIKNFRKFLRSPYINPYPKAERLFDALMSFYPAFLPGELTRMEVFKRMNRGHGNSSNGYHKNRCHENNTAGAYNDSTMRDLISKLKFLLDKYLAYCSFEASSFDYLHHIRAQMYSRKLHNLVERNIKDSENSVAAYTEADPDFFYKKIKIETEKFNNFVVNRKLYSRQSFHQAVTSLNNTAKNHLALFILETIKQNDTILKITKRQGQEGSRNLIPELLEPIDLKKIIVTLKKNDAELSHIFQIYYHLYMLFSSRKGEQYFHLYKQSIIESSGKINTDELHFLYGRLIDYCVNKCNEGRAEYYRELFNAYEIMLERKYYTNSSNRYISQDLFRNIFQTAIRINNSKWAENFIIKYRKELHPLNRDNMYYYCWSYIYFENGDPAKALEYILKIKQDYFALKIDIKILILKIYYELRMYEHIYNQLDSFKHFISNHELTSPSRRKKIKDFIRLFEKILKAALRDDRESAVLLHRELSSKEDKQFFGWLLVKAEQIKEPVKLKLKQKTVI